MVERPSLSVLILAMSIVAAVVAPILPAHADAGPVIVIPSRPGVPTTINGRNANYAVVEGDWGLARPGHMAPHVIGGRPIHPTRAYAPRRSYFPSFGAPPMRGRHEIEPDPGRPLPEPAEAYSRSWTTQGAPAAVPATLYDPNAVIPPMVVVPEIRGRRP